MKQYRNTGIALLIISMGGLIYVLVNILLFPDVAMVNKQTFWWFLLQCSASLVSGILGGYFLGVYKEKRRPSS